jgi:hypothetical protein
MGTQPPARRRARIDLKDLAETVDSLPDEMSGYLDLETGKAIVVDPEARRELEGIWETMPEHLTGAAYEAVFAEALERRNVPDWMREQIREADAVESGFGTRYIELPDVTSRDGYRDMEAFIETVDNPGVQQRLWAAIEGRGAFRPFKDTLTRYPAERERWFAFRDQRSRARILAWLADEDIEPIEETE